MCEWCHSILCSFLYMSSWGHLMLELNLLSSASPTQWDFTWGALGFCLYFFLPERNDSFESRHKATDVREENFYAAEDAWCWFTSPAGFLNKHGLGNESSFLGCVDGAVMVASVAPTTRMWFRKGVSFYSSDSSLSWFLSGGKLKKWDFFSKRF